MWNVAIKNLWARKLRLVTTSVAVLLGVSFMAGTLVLTNTMNKTFDDLFASAFEGVDALVREPEAFAGSQGADAQRALVDEALIPVVASVSGVESVDGTIQGYTQVVDKNNKPVGAGGAPTYGGIWNPDPSTNAFKLYEGNAPASENQVVLDRQTAKKTGYRVGDEITLLVNGPPLKVTVSGISKFGTADSPAGASFVLFTQEAAQKYIGRAGKFDAIEAQAKPGVSQEELKQRIRAAVPTGLEILTGDQAVKESQNSVKQGLSFFRTFLLVFAGIALFVGVFIIYNTFSILVAQRTRETALLRAIGATRRQVARSVMIEAFAVGTIAGFLGLLAGIGLAIGIAKALTAIGVDLPTSDLNVPGSAVIASLVVGVVVSLVSAYLPARRGSRIPPIAAMRDVAIDLTGTSKKRIIFGSLLLLTGIALIVGGLLSSSGKSYIAVGIGAIVTFLAVAALGPILVRPLMSVIGWPAGRMRGVSGSLARQNAVRNPKRTSSTASALMIGVGLVGFMVILTASIKASVFDIIDKTLTGDYVIRTVGGQQVETGLPTQMTAEIQKLPQVRAAVGFPFGQAAIDGKPAVVQGVDPETLPDLVDPNIKQGSLSGLGPNEIVISQGVANANNWSVGTRLGAKFVKTGESKFTVKGIYDNDAVGSGYLISNSAFDANFDLRQDAVVFVAKNRNADAAEARRAVESVTNNYPNAKLQDQTEFKADFTKQIDQFLLFFVALLGLAVLIALIGIANTLVLSIYERTHEIGLLRAIGMTRRQVRSMVRWESVLMALFGTLLGLAVAVFFGAALVHSLKDEGITRFEVPVIRLVIIGIVACIAGVLAAVWPARRASRLNVLDAISTG